MAHRLPVSVETSHDPLTRMRAYQLASELIPDCFEGALESARESMSWYKSSKPVLGEETVLERRNRLEEIRRILLAVIPRERAAP